MEVNQQTSANWVRNTEKYDVQKELIIWGPTGVSSFLKLCHQVFLGPEAVRGSKILFAQQKQKRKDLSWLRFVGCSFALDYPSSVVTLPGEGFYIPVLGFCVQTGS